MTEPEQQPDAHSGRAQAADAQTVVVVGPDGTPIGTMRAVDGAPGGAQQDDSDGTGTNAIEQPAKVMRIGSMVKQLLEEVRAAPLDDASRTRLRSIHETSIRELSDGLSAELRSELERITLPFSESGIPSDAELRVAQAQLVGWLEGLFHGIQTAMFAQQMIAKMQMEAGARQALPSGSVPLGGPGGPGAVPGSSASGPYL